MEVAKGQYLKNLLIAIDQLFNALFGNYCDETLSAHAYRRSTKGKPLFANIIDTIFFWEKNHCYESYLSEVYRKQYPDEYKNIK